MSVYRYWNGTEWVKLVEEAPEDGTQYARKDGAWEAVVPGGGTGLPNGGTAGQFLVKQSGTDGDADWEDLVIDGGGA